MAAAILALWHYWLTPAQADALWDFYYGPDAVHCNAIGAIPEQATAVNHRLNEVVGMDEINMRLWFVEHPQYAAEVARRRRYYRTHCRRD
jgi:hypothetical protein